MFNYVFKHILGAAISLWIISMLIFFLSKAVPGDPVQGLKEVSEGIYFLDYEKEYKQKAIAQNLHLPEFYFSLLPANFPSNINEIMPLEKKKYIKQLLFDGYEFEDIKVYSDALNDYLDQMDKATLGNLKVENLKWNNHLDKVSEILNQLVIDDALKTGDVSTSDMILLLQKLNVSRHNFFIPTFRWHGTHNQYHSWISSILRGDPGNSIIDGKPVSQKIGRALVWTVFLVLISLFLSYGIGIFIGLGLSYLKQSLIKKIIERFLFGIYAIPVFWLATLLLVFFTTREYGAWTNIFPSVGLAPIDSGDPWYERIRDFGGQLILPCFILVLHSLAFVSTLVKRNAENYKDSAFVMTAKAYGFGDAEIMWREIFPHTLLPIITSITSSIPSALAGSLVIEIIFNIPGVGRLLFNSISTSDWPVVFAIVMLIAVITILSFFLAEVLYRWADPRIKQRA